MAHNIWKDLNFEMGWLLNCCNHGFSGFLVPQRREMKNNIWQSLDLESFLLFQEEREKKNFRLSRLNSYLAFFFLFFFFFPVLLPVSHLRPFSLRHTLEAKVSLPVCEEKCCLKGMFDDNFRGTIFHILTRMEGTLWHRNKGGVDLDRFTRSGQSSYVMVLGPFFSHLKMGSWKWFFFLDSFGSFWTLQIGQTMVNLMYSI